MNRLTYEGNTYLVTRCDAVTVGVRPIEPNRVGILTIHQSGEITLITKIVPWMYERLNPIGKDERYAESR
jgi:hypothetical protein